MGLGDGDDLVIRLELLAEVGGAAGDDFLDDAVVVLDPEHGADADELQFHLDAEVLEGGGAEISRVGVVEPRDVGQEQLGQVAAVDFAEILEHALVALAHGRLGLDDSLLVHQLGNELIFDPLPPQGVGPLHGGGPFGLGAVNQVAVIHREISVILQFLEHPGQARAGAALVDGKDIVGGVDVSQGAQVPVDILPKLGGEGGLVPGDKKQPLSVQVAHVIGDNLRIVAAVHRLAVVMRLLEQLDQCAGLGAEGGRGREMPVGDGKGGGWGGMLDHDRLRGRLRRGAGRDGLGCDGGGKDLRRNRRGRGLGGNRRWDG